MGHYSTLARLEADRDRDDEVRPEPEPIEPCGKTSPTATERGIPHLPCPLPKGHRHICYFESV